MPFNKQKLHQNFSSNCPQFHGIRRSTVSVVVINTTSQYFLPFTIIPSSSSFLTSLRGLSKIALAGVFLFPYQIDNKMTNPLILRFIYNCHKWPKTVLTKLQKHIFYKSGHVGREQFLLDSFPNRMPR